MTYHLTFEIGQNLLYLGRLILLAVAVVYLVRQWWEFATIQRRG